VLSLLPAVNGETRVKLGPVVVGAGYTHYSGYPDYPYAFQPYPWDPFWWPGSPWFASAIHPGYWAGYPRGAEMGEVRLKTEAASAEVYLDGAYAGVAKDRKTMWLEPGAYNLEVRDASGDSFKKRIYVLSGKTLRIEAELKPPEEGKEDRP